MRARRRKARFGGLWRDFTFSSISSRSVLLRAFSLLICRNYLTKPKKKASGSIRAIILISCAELHWRKILNAGFGGKIKSLQGRRGLSRVFFFSISKLCRHNDSVLHFFLVVHNSSLAISSFRPRSLLPEGRVLGIAR